MAEYIEREALLTARSEAIRTYENASIYNANAIREGLKPLLDAIVDAPAADVAPVVHGEWKFEHDPINDPKKYFIRIVCSCCGLKTGQKSNYCPNCGAKMQGGKDNV